MAKFQTLFVPLLPNGEVYLVDGAPAVIGVSAEDARMKLAALITLEPALASLNLWIGEAAIIGLDALRFHEDVLRQEGSSGGRVAETPTEEASGTPTPHEEALTASARDALYSAGLLLDKGADTPADARYFALIQTASFKQMHEIHSMEGLAAQGFGQDAFVVFISEGKAPMRAGIAQNTDVVANLEKMVRTASAYFRTRKDDRFYPIIDWLYEPRDNSVLLIAGEPVAKNPYGR